MRFGLLGPLSVRGDDGEPVRVPERKVRVLLAALLLGEGRTVSTARLVEALWGDRHPVNPTAALQTKASHVRRLLDVLTPGGRERLITEPSGYRLALEPGAVDAEVFAELTARAYASEDPQVKAAVLADALALWRGPALVDFVDDDFARAATARLEELRLTAVEERAEARLRLGEHRLLVGDLDDLVVLHPFRERLRAAHLLALYRSGRQSAALTEFAALRARLRDEFGLDPGDGLVALHRAILTRDPALDSPAAPATSVARPRHNVPVPLTELVGRSTAVDAVRRLLATNRLVTLTGPGGVGKTRLAVEAANQLVDEFADGVWLVELAERRHRGVPASPPELAEVAEVVAGALDVRDDASGAGLLTDGPPIDLPARLSAAVRHKRMLLILDNCEHLLEPVAELAATLLRAGADLKVLATSREPLGLAGEVLWPVPPLDLPGSTRQVERLRESSAVRLFVQRAAATAPGFALTAENAEAVASVCAKLDGIPLALELAATRVRALDPAELAARLDDRFRVLDSGLRGAPARQQTLRAVIDWSWDLLTASERTALRRLALLSGDWTVEAAEAVAGFGELAPRAVLPLLARLVDRSLVATAQTGAGTRYRLLGSVAAYALERLREAGEADAVLLRHDEYYTALCERAEPHLRGHEQQKWIRGLDADNAGVRSALESAVRRRDAPMALRLVNALSWYWVLRGRLGEAHRWAGCALDLATEADAAAANVAAWRLGIAMLVGADPGGRDRADEVLRRFDRLDHPRCRARAEWFLGFAHLTTGGIEDSEALVRSAYVRFRESDDRWGTAAALTTQSLHALFRGDLRAVRRHGEAGLALFSELGDRWGRLQAVDALGSLAAISGDYVAAGRLDRDGLRTAEELGLWTEVSHSLSRMGRVALLTGDYAQADELHERARRLAAEQSNRLGELFAEMGLALGARRRGDFELAERKLRALMRFTPDRTPDHGDALLLAELGFVAEQRGAADEALRLHLDGYEAARATGDPRAVALALEGLAGARAAAGAFRDAARLLGTADATRTSVHAPLPEAERQDVIRIGAAVRAGLADDERVAALRHGADLTPDESVRLSCPQPADARTAT
ncbi:BTAD domain-containing putative transcriptional regulator [Saccharothrix sp. HUAS TT1]|uniref:AfsR/SARP family transcriptional regulator n=1 Tax=unclassified Saccharothrix TaxID=2593673 RepID=UPI00345B7D12